MVIAMIKPKFNRDDKVMVKGMPKPLTVYRPMIIPVPKVVNGQFLLVDEVMYKFKVGNNDYRYAYEADVDAL